MTVDELEKLEKQGKEFEEATAKLVELAMKFAEEKGRLDGLKTSGTIDDDKAFKEGLKNGLKLLLELIGWHIKLTMAHNTMFMALLEEIKK